MKKITVNTVLMIVVALMLIGCGAAKRDWEKAKNVGTVEAYKNFLVNHPRSTEATWARDRLEQLSADVDWKRAKSINTSAAYKEFLKNHPESKSYYKSKSRHYYQAKAKLKESEAIDRAWQRAISSTGYEEFAKKYPDDPRAQEAKVYIDNTYSLIRSAKTISLCLDISFTSETVSSGLLPDSESESLKRPIVYEMSRVLYGIWDCGLGKDFLTEYASGRGFLQPDCPKSAENSDLHFVIKALCRPTRGLYSDGNVYYRGASLMGSISIESAGRLKLRRYFIYIHTPSSGVIPYLKGTKPSKHGNYGHIVNCPKSFADELVQMMADIYGSEKIDDVYDRCGILLDRDVILRVKKLYESPN